MTTLTRHAPAPVSEPPGQRTQLPLLLRRHRRQRGQHGPAGLERRHRLARHRHGDVLDLVTERRQESRRVLPRPHALGVDVGVGDHRLGEAGDPQPPGLAVAG